MQISCLHPNHRVVVRDNFNMLLPNEKQLDIPDIHGTITTLLIIYNSRLTAVSLSEFKCYSTATAVQLNPLQLHPILLEMDTTDWDCERMCERNRSRASQQKLTARNREGKGLKRTKQTERSERVVQEDSLDKDRQKDRISLSHSRGRGNKRRLQREWDRVRDSLEKSAEAAKSSPKIAMVLCFTCQ